MCSFPSTEEDIKMVSRDRCLDHSELGLVCWAKSYNTDTWKTVKEQRTDYCQSFPPLGVITIEVHLQTTRQTPKHSLEQSAFLVAEKMTSCNPQLCFLCMRRNSADFKSRLFFAHLIFWRSSRFNVLMGPSCFWASRGLLSFFILRITSDLLTFDYIQLVRKCQMAMP